MLAIGEGLLQFCFHGGERNHFAGDLGEALGAAEDGDIAHVIDLDDVAGVIPATGRGFDNAGIIGAEITQHDIRTLDEQASAFLDAGHRLKPVFDAVEQAAHRAGLVVHRRVEGNGWRTFGGAIALENAQAEFLHPDIARLGLDALGARHHEAHVEEIIRVGILRVAHEERIGAEQHRGIGVITEFRHHLVMQRRRILKAADAAEHRQQGASQQPESVEDRQRVEDDVLCRESDTRGGLIAVGMEVAVRQHDALRHAFRTGGEQDDGGLVRIA